MHPDGLHDLRNVKAIIILILFAGIFRARQIGFENEGRQVTVGLAGELNEILEADCLVPAHSCGCCWRLVCL